MKRKAPARRKIIPVAITTGDHRGIGPEVISKGLKRLSRSLRPHDVVIFGIPEVYRPFKTLLPRKWHIWTENEASTPAWPGPELNHLNFIVPHTNHLDAAKRGAFCCGRYIELATLGALKGLFSAITTGPIDKNELHRGGFNYDGHTEMLRDLCRAPSVTMMMSGLKMRTTLVTTHEALRDVAARITTERIVTCAENTVVGLVRDFGIKAPRIAVLGLNPHASDNGLFGDEERTKIAPAIEIVRSRFPNVTIEGPFAPDGFFAQWRTRHTKAFDAIVCMYHDQGLIPIKLLDFENTVNVTLGLPIIRTSVDHGVGYDIAGQNKADPASFCAALKLAANIARRRSAQGRAK
ncbi:MAG: 4-hydroxythreonine-4-phosphate dehydrogenase PdxA [Deltaproteobacteria bacterium]|nr:4-hydroxythreonine-4-phosphate dehydrogenase PdxA [Deltaproteobacteria bacterium]